MGGENSEQRCRYYPETHHDTASGFVISPFIRIGSEYQAEALKKVIRVTALDTPNHTITGTLPGKEEEWLGLQTPLAFLRPFAALLENHRDWDLTRCHESQSTL